MLFLKNIEYIAQLNNPIKKHSVEKINQWINFQLN